MTKLELDEKTWTGAAIVGRGNGKVVAEIGGRLSNATSQKPRAREVSKRREWSIVTVILSEYILWTWKDGQAVFLGGRDCC